MDKLSNCMICEIDLTNDKLTNVVVVSDATCRGFEYSNDMVSFELDESPYRAVHCNECWGSLVVHSWKLREEKGKQRMEKS